MSDSITEKSVRILIALGASSFEIAKELEGLEKEEIKIITRNAKNFYKKEKIISFLDEKSDIEISQLAQIPEEVVSQIREEHEKQMEDMRISIALGLSLRNIMKKMNIRFYNYIL